MQKGPGHPLFSTILLPPYSLPTFHQFSIHSLTQGIGSPGGMYEKVYMLSLPGHLW